MIQAEVKIHGRTLDIALYVDGSSVIIDRSTNEAVALGRNTAEADQLQAAVKYISKITRYTERGNLSKLDERA